MKPVFILPSADADLGEIYEWIASDNPAAAERLVTRLATSARNLAAFPERGAPRPELGVEVRSLVVGRYLILYRVEPERVDIVRFVHGARELDGLVGQEE